ncbi:hypothetical protein [Azospirillum argentinense]|uniref:Uncharacterized protein n=1 Tax=Azospirillum argentinense TaxID=2970906 RepID=A0A5B0KUQ9_9PROT|nr:hypothetical protein [Azospirillum argentinense]KAA1055799.1 hypothetical protein FH063_005570 [Azospirillum argentinense]
MLKVAVPAHLKCYSFDAIAERYGVGFTQRLMEEWSGRSGAVKFASSSDYGIYCAFRHILIWSSETDIPACRSVCSDFIHGNKHNSSDWSNLLLHYKSLVIDRRNLKRGSIGTKISYVNAAADFLFRCGVVPDVPLLRQPSNVRATTTPRSSLALLKCSDVREAHDLNAKYHFPGKEIPDAIPDSRADIKDLQSLNETRLSELTRIAERSFLECYDDFVRGKKILETNVPDDYLDMAKSIRAMGEELVFAHRAGG